LADNETLPELDVTTESELYTAPEAHAFVIAWSRDEPWRIGQSFLVPPGNSGRMFVWGRGPAENEGDERIFLQENRPCEAAPTTPLSSPSISRKQVEIRCSSEDHVFVRNVGKCPLFKNGAPVSQAEFRAGDTLQLGKQVLFIVVRRPVLLLGKTIAYPAFAFGEADAHGIVGESAAAWRLRAQIAMFAPQEGHLLILGASGSGKELVAQAIHSLSRRGHRRMVARNAATLPETLMDAELFGNCRNYPNSGMPERPGLIGEASGSSLFLDEIAELPHASQAHLLRVLDRGEYQRLGEATCRQADLRLLAATNRDASLLKTDFLARLRLRIVVPNLNARKEDIPLLVRHLVRTAKDDVRASIVPLATMRALLERQYELNVRELEAVVRNGFVPAELRLSEERAPASSSACQGDSLQRSESSTPGAGSASDSLQSVHPKSKPKRDLTPDKIQRCLDENNGVLELTWRALGLSNRYALVRLVKKYQLEVRRRLRQTQRRRRHGPR
jgi:transcriptional regulator with GAF, ATPase, and Fis domain